MNYYVPATIIDDFFEDPMAVREFALQQEYHNESGGRWPGKRSGLLHEINPELFKLVVDKVIRIYYPNEELFQHFTTMSFQLIDKSFGEGWVHCDIDSLVTGIIYLNPNNTQSSGTSLYTAKTPGARPIHLETKENFYKGSVANADAERIESNSQFEETVTVKNKFNRLFLFDSHIYHAAHEYTGDSLETDRLTLVFFINRLAINKYPLERVRTLS